MIDRACGQQLTAKSKGGYGGPPIGTLSVEETMAPKLTKADSCTQQRE